MILETLKWEYTFGTDVLIAIRYESPLVQGRRTFRDMTMHFGTRNFGTFSIRYSHFETCPIRNIVTSGHVISGKARFGTAQQHYFKYNMFARCKRQFGSNSLLFTPFMTVYRSTRDRKLTNGHIYSTIQYNTIQYNTIQYNTIQYNTIQYNTIQYNTITLYCPLNGKFGYTAFVYNNKKPRKQS